MGFKLPYDSILYKYNAILFPYYTERFFQVNPPCKKRTFNFEKDPFQMFGSICLFING